MTYFLRLVLISLTALMPFSILRAGTIVIPASSRGYIDSLGDSAFSDSGAYDAALTLSSQGEVEIRNEFLFVIPNLPGPVERATLVLDAGGINTTTPDGKTFILTSAPLLFPAFDDLGTGKPYGSIRLTHSDTFQLLRVPLDLNARTAIRSNQPFVISGRFNNVLSTDFGRRGQIPTGTIAFLGTANRTVELIVTYADPAQASPEPRTMTLTGAGLATLACLARRRTPRA